MKNLTRKLSLPEFYHPKQLTFDQRQQFTAAVIRPELLAREPRLSLTKHPMYRSITNLQAAHEVYKAYRDIHGRAKAHLNPRVKKSRMMGVEAQWWTNPQRAGQVWALRQLLDRHGFEYDWAIYRMIDYCMNNGYKHVPLIHQLMTKRWIRYLEGQLAEEWRDRLTTIPVNYDVYEGQKPVCVGMPFSHNSENPVCRKCPFEIECAGRAARNMDAISETLLEREERRKATDAKAKRKKRAKLKNDSEWQARNREQSRERMRRMRERKRTECGSGGSNVVAEEASG